MTTITREFPVPFTVEYNSSIDTVNFLKQKLEENSNQFISFDNFRILELPLKISQSSAAVIYTVQYTEHKIIPEPNRIYEGEVSEILTHGIQVTVPFEIFINTRKSLHVGQRVRVKLIATRKNAKGYLCVGELAE
jgi:hypothetical protein